MQGIRRRCGRPREGGSRRAQKEERGGASRRAEGEGSRAKGKGGGTRLFQMRAQGGTECQILPRMRRQDRRKVPRLLQMRAQGRKGTKSSAPSAAAKLRRRCRNDPIRRLERSRSGSVRLNRGAFLMSPQTFPIGGTYP